MERWEEDIPNGGKFSESMGLNGIQLKGQSCDRYLLKETERYPRLKHPAVK